MILNMIVKLSMCAILLGTVSMAHAGALKDAIKAGQVCEKMDGYVAAQPGYETDNIITTLVNRINVKRTGVYQKIADDRGTSIEVVGAESADERREKDSSRFCR